MWKQESMLDKGIIMLKVLTKGCEQTRGSKYSAAVDLYASEDCIIAAGETKIIGLGVAIDFDNWFRKHKDFMNETYYDKKIPEFKLSHYLELHPRSSIRAKGIISNTGIIDLDYIPHCRLGKINNNGECNGYEPK